MLRRRPKNMPEVPRVILMDPDPVSTNVVNRVIRRVEVASVQASPPPKAGPQRCNHLVKSMDLAHAASCLATEFCTWLLCGVRVSALQQ